jgi:hypothetical protein
MMLRVIAATDTGASAACVPEFESLRFQRPLDVCEAVRVCVIQLVTGRETRVADSLPVSGGLLAAALRELNWEAAAETAEEWGIENALRTQLERIESHYQCSCGAQWEDTWWRTGDDRCSLCGATCRPRVWRHLRSVFRSKIALNEERVDVLDIA